MTTIEDDTPAQRRTREELLAWGQPRPAVPAGFVDQMHRRVEEVVAPSLARLPAGEDVWLSKGTLDALVCDGRYLDQKESPFEPSPRMVAGLLAHRAVEVDHANRRETVPAHVVTYAWDDLASQQRWYGEVIRSTDSMTANVMRQQAQQELLEFRDTFPPLPEWLSVRSEPPMRVRLGGGRLTLAGQPDLMIGDVKDDRARLLLIDLKTGQRYPQRERQDLRFYGLLATLKYRQPPFRWATFYLAEGDWDLEDFTPGSLDGVVRRIGMAVERLVTLTLDRPDDADLHLEGGPQCRFCSRRPDCPAAVYAEDD